MSVLTAAAEVLEWLQLLPNFALCCRNSRCVSSYIYVQRNSWTFSQSFWGARCNILKLFQSRITQSRKKALGSAQYNNTPFSHIEMRLWIDDWCYWSNPSQIQVGKPKHILVNKIHLIELHAKILLMFIIGIDLLLEALKISCIAKNLATYFRFYEEHDYWQKT